MENAGKWKMRANGKCGNVARLPASRHNWQANAHPDQMPLCHDRDVA
jgi:hypothetical protein